MGHSYGSATMPRRIPGTGLRTRCLRSAARRGRTLRRSPWRPATRWSCAYLGSLLGTCQGVIGPVPDELAFRAYGEVRSACGAIRAVVELGITRIGLCEGLPHGGDRSALQVHVGTAHRAHESLGPFLLGEDEVLLLHAVRADLPQAGIVAIICDAHAS